MTTLEKVVGDFRRTMAVMAWFSLATNLLLLAIPLYMLQIYDRVLPSQSSQTLVYLSLIALAALVVLGLLEVTRTIIANRAAARFDVGLADHAMRRAIARGSASGGNVQPVLDIVSLANLLSSKVVFGLLDLPFASIFIAFLYFIHPSLFWITLAGAVVLVAIAIANQMTIARASRGQAEATISSAERASHLARNADSLTAMGMVGNVVDRWGAGHAEALASADRAGRINAWFGGLSRTVRFGLQIAILGYGARLVIEGEMTPGMIFAASLISGRALQPIDQVIGAWRQLAGGLQAWRRLRAFLAEDGPRREYTALPAPRGRIEASNLLVPNPLDPGKPPILSGVSFRIQPGETVVALGASGSGKSTLARLIVGAARPRAGHVRLDGHDIVNWDPEDLGRHIGYLAQDVELIPGTIAQNISRFDPEADDAAIVAAARLAHAEDLIQKLPRGYDTPIGPGGLQISGGEKQRIGLARALYGDPRVLVLDEPNSNLDRIGEQALMRALAEAKARGVTVLVITQREMVLGIADKLLRLHEGRLTDFDDRDKVERKYGARPAAPPSMPGDVPVAAVAGVGARFIRPVRGREPGAS